MTRIFTTLAATCYLALLVAFGLGAWSKLVGGITDAGSSVYVLHFLTGLFSSVGTLLVHCLIFTYFLGTGRWVKEVGLVYELPDHDLPKLTRELKRSTFPPALFAMLVTIAASATGAGVQLQAWPWWLHFATAAATLWINAWAMRVEYDALQTNAAALERVMAEVDRIRGERGLPSNAEALADGSG